MDSAHKRDWEFQEIALSYTTQWMAQTGWSEEGAPPTFYYYFVGLPIPGPTIGGLAGLPRLTKLATEESTTRPDPSTTVRAHRLD